MLVNGISILCKMWGGLPLINQLQTSVKQFVSVQGSKRQHHLLPMALLLALTSSFFLLDAVLPLQNLGFVDALLTQFGNWPLWPAHILFPGLALIQDVVGKHVHRVVSITQSWEETGLLF